MVHGQDDWLALHRLYPHVAFNFRGFDGTLYGPETRHTVLVQCEPWTNMPQNWDLNVLRKFKAVITFNYRFYCMYRYVLNIRFMPGVLACNSEYQLDHWPTYDRRQNGVCCLNNCYYLGRRGDILWLRPEVMANLDVNLVRHVWAPKSRAWGGEIYQGEVQAPIHHSHINHLKKISEYRFCLCFESTYHPFWSRGFVTERLFNCFKAKTIPIYLGCYDIEKYVSPNLFIDFRKFYSEKLRDYDGLNKLLLSYNQSRWEEQVEAAYRWNKTHNFGSVNRLRELIEEVS